jgi:hypothetical protein
MLVYLAIIVLTAPLIAFGSGWMLAAGVDKIYTKFHTY